MNAVYHQVLDARERARIARLEVFDELEEWLMIQ